MLCINEECINNCGLQLEAVLVNAQQQSVHLYMVGSYVAVL